MVFNVTYYNKDTEKKIKDLIGEPYSLLEKIKLKGVGTSKMQIIDASENMASYFSSHYDSRFCYLELRREGLLVGFQSILKTFSWAIPFYELSIYYNGGILSIYSKSDHLKVKPPFNGYVDKKYLKKVLFKKAEYFERNNFNL